MGRDAKRKVDDRRIRNPNGGDPCRPSGDLALTMEALRLLEALAYAHAYSSTEIAADPHRVDAQAG